ncbi:MAG: exosortase family protein XrtG [Lachnospiraceae bacterium]|nr:exosortase family protein XrtG [Lachnospiraceae bacterium]
MEWLIRIIAIIAVILWIYLLGVFRRGKLEFFHFLLGVCGIFLILLFMTNYIKGPLIYGFTSVLRVYGGMFELFDAYPSLGIIYIETENTIASLYIDLECSGIIEMIVFVSLLSFFPVYNWRQKLINGVIGCFCIELFNFFRIIIIVMSIRIFGTDAYFVAHAIVGRLVFYCLVIILYYYIFTKTQIQHQRIGKFSYAQVNEKKEGKMR